MVVWYELSRFQSELKLLSFGKEAVFKKSLPQAETQFLFAFRFFHLSCLSFTKQAWTVIAADSLCLNCIFALLKKKDSCCCLLPS